MELAAQQAATDYACIRGSCQNMLLLRPSTIHFRVLGKEKCPDIVLPTPAWTTTVTTTEPPPTTPGKRVGLDSSEPPEDLDSWPHSWGPWQWFGVTAPLGGLLAVLCGVYLRSRAQGTKLRRVHVEEEPPLPGIGGVNANLWDFTQAGPLSPEQIEAVEVAIAYAERRATITGRMPPRRRLAVGACNDLGMAHFSNLGRLLDKHQAVSLRLDMDWRGANDAALAELSKLLQRKGRCQLHTQGSDQGDSAFRLPLHGNVAALGNIGEALSVAGHSNVDAVSLQAADSSLAGPLPPILVPLGPLRLSAQQLMLSRHHVGDPGCAIACGFSRPWAGRLTAMRFLECDIGDAGAAEIARLLLGEPKRARDPSVPAAAASLRELVLSANRISDQGITRIAEALPKCDALERLIIDRNCIGSSGAVALAKRVPRSNLRELVLGSHLGGNPVGPSGAEALARVLDDSMERAAADRPNRLQALNLEDCKVGLLGARALAEALPRSAVSALCLARGQLGDHGAAMVLEGVPPGLVALDLAGNHLTDDLGILVGRSLGRLPSLSVSLAQNELSSRLKDILREEHGARLRV